MFRQNKKKTPRAIDNQGFIFFRKWYHLELNQGHTDFQSVALPTELWYLFGLERQK